MSVTATGSLAVAAAALADMVAACATFQKLCGYSGDAVTARAFVPILAHEGDLPRPGAALVAMPGDGWAPPCTAGGSRLWYAPGGRLELTIEAAAQIAMDAMSGGLGLSYRDFSCGYSGHGDGWFVGWQVRWRAGAARAGLVDVITSYTSATGRIRTNAILGTPEVVEGDPFDLLCYSSASPAADANTWWLNVVGAIETELRALSGQGGYLALHVLRLADWGRVKDEERDVDYFGARLDCEFGV